MNVFSEAICKREQRKEMRRNRKISIGNILVNAGYRPKTDEYKEADAKLRCMISLLHKVDVAIKNNEQKKNPLYRAFNQLGNIIEVFRFFGQEEDLKRYFSLLPDCDLSVKPSFSSFRQKEGVEVMLAKLMLSFDPEDGVKDELAAMAKDADEKAICPKNRFSALTRIAEKAAKDKDKAMDLLQTERTFAEMTSHGADIVEEMLG